VLQSWYSSPSTPLPKHAVEKINFSARYLVLVPSDTPRALPGTLNHSHRDLVEMTKRTTRKMLYDKLDNGCYSGLM